MASEDRNTEPVSEPKATVAPTNRITELETPAVDEFDPARLALPQDFAEGFGVKQILSNVPIKRPPNFWFSRVHPSHHVDTYLYEQDREMYLVDPSLWQTLPEIFTPYRLFLAVNKQGVVFWWPARLPGKDGKPNPWHSSRIDAAERAVDKWIRIVADLNAGCYSIFEATGDLGEPVWPNESVPELLRLAFRDSVINTLDHPILKSLRGEI